MTARDYDPGDGTREPRPPKRQPKPPAENTVFGPSLLLDDVLADLEVEKAESQGQQMERELHDLAGPVVHPPEPPKADPLGEVKDEIIEKAIRQNQRQDQKWEVLPRDMALAEAVEYVGDFSNAELSADRITDLRKAELDPRVEALLYNYALTEWKNGAGLSHRPAESLWRSTEPEPEAEEPEEGQGSAIILTDIEPCEEQVDGAELLDELVETIGRYGFMPTGGVQTAALYSVFTHAYDCFEICPRLVLPSPVIRCGKTSVATVLCYLSNRVLPASNISSAGFYRSVERWHPVLFIDEADTAFKKNDELRQIANSGHTRPFAFVIRCVGDDQEPRIFSTWCPMLIALVGRLPGSLLDRSHVIPMSRKPKGMELEDAFDPALREKLKPLARKIARWVADHREPLRAAKPSVPEELNDRARNNWKPFLAIADEAGGRWPVVARKAAIELCGLVDEGEDSLGIQLLADLRDLFAERRAERLRSDAIVEELAEMEDRPWPEMPWSHKALTTQGLARLLKPFEIKPTQLKFAGENKKGYERAWFKDAWERYLAEAPQA